MLIISVPSVFAQSIIENQLDFFGNFTSNENLINSIIDFDAIGANLGIELSFTDLIFYSIGMVVYGIFIWNFYRFLARREMIPLPLTKYQTDGKKITSIFGYVIKYVFIFPLVVLVWFVVYSTFLFFMAPDLPRDIVFLVVISLVVTVRISAYYKEDLAKDFAKLIPFALLGIFLTSNIFFTTEQLLDRLDDFIPFIGKIIGFVVYAILVEATLRILFLVKRKILPVADQKLEEQIEKQIDEKINVHVTKIEKKQEDIEKKIEKETDDIEKIIEQKHDYIEKKIEKETDDIEKKLDDKNSNSKNDLKKE